MKWDMSRDAEIVAMAEALCQPCELPQSLRHGVADLGGVGESLAKKTLKNGKDGLRIKVVSDLRALGKLPATAELSTA